MSQTTWKPALASNTSWTIKGVTETTREAVREAVAQTDMLIGEWVDEALRHAAQSALRPPPPLATQADVDKLRTELSQDRPVVRHVLVERRRPARFSPHPGRKGEDDTS